MAHPFDYFVTLQMLRSVSEATSDGVPHTVHLDQLRPDDALILKFLPSLLTFQLASIIDQDLASQFMERVQEAGENNSAKTFADMMDRLLKQLTFLTCPVFPPADENLIFADLIIGMANYIILSRVLYQYLEDGKTHHVFVWSDGLDLDPVHPDIRLDYGAKLLNLIILLWLANTLSLASVRLNGALEADNSGEDDVPWIPLPVVTRFRREDAENKSPLNPYCHTVGIHPLDEEVEPKDGYELWVVFDEDNTISFNFKPLWNVDGIHFVEKLVNILLAIEIDLRNIVIQLRNSWENFSNKLEEFAINHMDAATKMMDSFMFMDNLVKTSFSYRALRKSIMTLDQDIQTNSKIDKGCDKYRKHFKKHIPTDIIHIFRESMPMILELWEKLKEWKYGDDESEENVRQYVKKNQDRYGFLTPAQAVKAAIQHGGDPKNGKRNFIEESLVSVAIKKGRYVSRLAIRKLIDSSLI